MAKQKDDTQKRKQKIKDPLSSPAVTSLLALAETELQNSEARFRTFFEAAPQPILEEDFSGVQGRFNELRSAGVTDLRGYLESNLEELLELASRVRILDANPSGLAMLGATSKDELTQSLPRLLPESSYPTFREEMAALFEGRTTFECEITNQEFGGNLLHLLLHLAIVPGHEATLDKVLVSFMDITKRKQAEEDLQEANEFNAQILQSAQVGIIVYDLNLRYIVWNPFMEQLTGMIASEVLGKYPWELFPFVHRNGLVDHMQKALKGESINSKDVLYQIPNSDKSGWTKDTHAPLHNSKGEIIGVIGIIHEVTKRKRAEGEIHDLNKNLERRVKERTVQLESANKELEAFSYSVSHDLRAPLRSIDGFSQVLLEDYSNQMDDAGTHYLQRIRQGAQRMGLLIDDLLKLSKTNRSELTLSECELSRLCSRVAVDLANLNSERKVEIIIQPDLMVQADHRLIQVVLENLLGNAWKFTSKCQDPRIEVGEKVSPSGERIFFVRDNGAGFDMAYADKLFNAFQRLHSATEYEGTGIGLAIVQRIIHRHGGRVWAEAKPGEGATFFFAIPERVLANDSHCGDVS